MTAYTVDDISALDDREHVRQRTQIYLGNLNPTQFDIPIFGEDGFEVKQFTFVPAAYKAVGEVIDNAIDEFSKITSKKKTLTITADPEAGSYTISDNGRGIPIGKKTIVENKRNVEYWAPELVLSRMRSGRNFTDEKEIGVIGQNGVGSSCTNFCSTKFEVTIHRDGKRYHQVFSDGAFNISKPTIEDVSVKETGTKVSFTLDPTVFKGNVSIPNEVMRNRAMEIAAANPDVTVIYNGETFKFKAGFEELTSRMIKNAADVTTYTFKTSTPTAEMTWQIIFGLHDEVDEKVFTWVNSSYLFDGGTCNTQFMNAFTSTAVTHLEPKAKREKAEINKNDVRQGLTVIGNCRIRNPEYDSQAKTRLTGPSTRRELTAMIADDWKSFVRKNDAWLEQVLRRAVDRHHTQRNKAATEQHKKRSGRKVPGLIDATSKNRSSCYLVITEGDSAASSLTDARDPATIGIYPMSGKMNNTHSMTPAQILSSGKLIDLLTIMGITPGRRNIRSELNFGGIIVATDADYDGADVFCLLANVFYTCDPSLFDPKYEPFMFRLNAPNVCLTKGDKRVHIPKASEYEAIKHKYKGWDVKYLKGLGGMVLEDWEMLFKDLNTSCIPIQDIDGTMKQTLDLLFRRGKLGASERKKWLVSHGLENDTSPDDASGE